MCVPFRGIIEVLNMTLTSFADEMVSFENAWCVPYQSIGAGLPSMDVAPHRQKTCFISSERGFREDV